MGEGLYPRGHGDFAALPPECSQRDCGKAGKLPVFDGHCLAYLRSSGISSGNHCRGQQGEDGGQGNQGILLVVASTPAFWLALMLLMIFGVWLKVLPVGLSVPIGGGSQRRHLLGQGAARYFACPGSKYHWNFQYHPCIPEKR